MLRAGFITLLLVFLVACTAVNPLPTSNPELIPYSSSTPALTPTVIPTVIQSYLPTPTTFTYIVVQGDTLIGIAARFGVTLEALAAANPSIQPSSLPVGTTLIIPTGEQTPGAPTPTPASLPVLQAKCWPDAAGGLWCFALLQNTYDGTLEDLSARFTLSDPSGQVLSDQVAYGLLDILPAGASMPLALHFASPVPENPALNVQILTAIRLLPGDTRYLPVTLQNTLVTIASNGLTAQVSGRVVLSGTGSSSSLWVLATAYDAAGEVVGVRRWDSPSTLSADQPVTFDFLVSSLGPRIARVDFLTEARP